MFWNIHPKIINYEFDAIEVKVLTQEDKILLQGSFENKRKRVRK